MVNEKKIINDFTDLLKSLTDSDKKTSKNTAEILALTNEQLKILRNLINSSADFQAQQTEAVFESQAAEEKYYEKMIKMEEKNFKKEDENFEDLIKEQEALLNSFETTSEEIKKSNKEKIKVDRKGKKKESERIDNFSKASNSFSTFALQISDMFEIGGFMSEFSAIKDLILSPIKQFGKTFQNLLMEPLKGVGNIGIGLAKGLGRTISGLVPGKGILEREKKETQQEDIMEYNQAMLDVLYEIEGNTTKEKEMIKSGSFLDTLKKFLPAGLFGASGLAGKAGGLLKKMAGAGMILAGLWLAVEDFMDGFKEGGIGKGLYKAFVGKSEGTIMGAFKNAGKWALIGAGIGSFVPVIGTIAGGLIGGAIGLLMNYVAGLVKSDAPIGDKITSALFGSGSGIMASVFHGSKYAAAGALIGSVVPVVGTIAGGAIGFALGFIIDFVRQIMPNSMKSKLSNLFSWMGDKISSAWDWAMGFLSDIWNSEFVTAIKNKTSMLSSKVSDTITPFFDWITNFIGGIWDEIKSITSNIWKNTKSWFGFGSSDDKKTKRIQPKIDKNQNLGLKSLGANISTSESVKKMSEETPKQTDVVESSNTLLELISNSLKDINSFLSEEMLNSLENIMKNANENMKVFFQQQNEMNRAWNFAMDTGSLSGYSGKYEMFAKDLETINKNKQEKQRMEQAFNQVNNNNNNTNIFSESSIEKRRSLRKGK